MSEMPRSASVPFAILNPTPTSTTSQRPLSIADSGNLHSPTSFGQSSSMAPFITPDVDGLESGVLAGDSELQIPGRSPILTSLPPFPGSPLEIDESKHVRDTSKNFFSNKKASKSSPRMIPHAPTIRQVSQETSRSLPQSRDNPVYTTRKPAGSTPDLSLSAFDLSADPPNESDDSVISRRPPGISAASDSNLSSTSVDSRQANRAKPRFPRLLTRTRSQRVDEGGRRSKPSTPVRTRITEVTIEIENTLESDGLRTAPLQQENDHSFGDMRRFERRNRSADRPSERQSTSEEGQGSLSGEHTDRPLPRGLTSLASASALRGEGPLREGVGTGSHLFSGFRSTSSKAADGIGKAGKGFMGVFTKGSSSANHPKEVSAEKDVQRDYERDYYCSNLEQPLRSQMRMTRLAPTLEEARDKTEFWLPAIAWRCIDYLNHKGYQEEGLYRVPGSQLEVKKLQIRFDQDRDINLIEEAGLFDVNIVGSILKHWLRHLPDEILPRATQNRIADAHPDATDVPQMLKDEISRLPPWDYYLLFAFTCHLHLLGQYVEDNKMTYSNLRTCLAPSLKIDHYCLNFLLNHWADCWQGCWFERQFRDEEYSYIATLSHRERNDNTMAGSASTNSLKRNDKDAMPCVPNDNNQAGYSWASPDAVRTRANQSGPDDGYSTSTQNENVTADDMNESELPELTFSPIRFSH